MVIPKPPAEVEKINYDDTFEKSRDGICSNAYIPTGDVQKVAEYQIGHTLQDCMKACDENKQCNRILFSTFTYGPNLSKYYCEIWSLDTTYGGREYVNTGSSACYLKKEQTVTLYNESLG